MIRHTTSILAGVVAIGLLMVSSTQAEEKQSAFLKVMVPEKAKLEIEGIATLQTGETRRFQTPALEVGKEYVYTLKVILEDGTSTKTWSKDVFITAGKTVEVDLRKSENTTAPNLNDVLFVDDKKDTIVVPYVPTPQPVVDKMLELAAVKEGDVVYDLGCGDGRIVITAVKKYKAKRGFGLDLNPERVKDSLKNAKASGVEKQLEFKEGDVLKLTDVSEANVVTLYLLPEVNKRLKPVLLKTLKPGSRVVSHDFDMGDDWKPEKEVEVDVDGVKHTVYLWIIKDKK
jgi:uncharacterized protein (TIGR03000 family)